MKIAMFTDYFFPELGGIQDSIATISRSLGRRGHQVDIYAPRYAEPDYRRIGVPVRERDLGENVRVRRRPSLPFPSSTRQSRAALLSPIAPALLAMRGKPDVIHAHSFFGIGLEALLNGAVLDIPVGSLEISVRAKTILRQLKASTLREVVRLTERDLRAHKEVNELSIAEVKKALAELGLSLRPSEPAKAGHP